MKEYQLQSGDKCFVVNIKHYITLVDFAFALMEYFYRYDNDMKTIAELNKKKAEDVLRLNLLKYGENGFTQDIKMNFHFQIINDEVRSRIYERVKVWIIENYPHLKKIKYYV